MSSFTDAKIVLMGVICLALGGSSVAVAAKVKNADKVDGIHAVRATVTNEKAAKKLVATDASGRIDPRFLPKVNDADKLDGLDSTAFLGATGKAADADKLDGLDSTAFLGATGKAADTDKLDGLDSTAFLGATGKAADADKLDGKDSTAFLEPCEAGTLWGRATIAGGSVATGDNPSVLSTDGVSSGYFCLGQTIRARKNSAGVYKVVFGDISGNVIGQGGPPPMVTALSTGVVASASGPFQCAPGAPPVLYEICYNVRTTNLTGAAVDANFTIAVQ